MCDCLSMMQYMHVRRQGTNFESKLQKIIIIELHQNETNEFVYELRVRAFVTMPILNGCAGTFYGL